MEIDYGIGEDFKEKLIPRAVDWFTGEALQFEQLGDDADEEGMFEDEDDEDEDDLSDDKDEDEDSEEEVSAVLDTVHGSWIRFKTEADSHTSRRVVRNPASRTPLSANKVEAVTIEVLDHSAPEGFASAATPCITSRR